MHSECSEFGLNDANLLVDRNRAVLETFVDRRLEVRDSLEDGRDRILELCLHLANHMGMIVDSAIEASELALEPFDLVRPFARSDGAAGLVVATTRAGSASSAALEAGTHRIGTGSATMAVEGGH